MRKYVFFILVWFAWGLGACVDDKGNYDYLDMEAVSINFSYNSASNNFTFIVDEEAEIVPNITWKNPEDSVYFSYAWIVDRDTISHEKVLKYAFPEIKFYTVRFIMVDTRSGISYEQVNSGGYMMSINVSVQSPYKTGFLILYKESDKSRLGYVKVQDIMDMGDPFDFTGYWNVPSVYKRYNNEEDLGADPVKLIQHFATLQETGGQADEILVIQRGGQGPVEVNGTTLKKVILTAQEFVNEALPADFAPLDVNYNAGMNVLLNRDGNLYNRKITSEYGFHSNAYNNVPMSIDVDNGESGGKISMLIQPNTMIVSSFLAYDEQHKRFVFVSNGGRNQAGMSILSHEGGWPENYVPLDNLGDYELVYASPYEDYTFMGSRYFLVLKDAEGKYWTESFNIDGSSIGAVDIAAGDKLKELPRGELITEKTTFFFFRTGAYLFFSGGANNDVLYCYNIGDNKTNVFYDKFKGQSITAMCPNEGYTFAMWMGYPGLAVGTDRGDFYFFDASDSAIYNGDPHVFTYTSGFGEIVDIIYKHTSTFLQWN